MGDVVGHSMRAATVMGELRHALRIYTLDGYDPPQVMERLGRLIRRFHPTMFASAIYGVLDLAAGELRCCNAGHLPLFLQPAKGPAHLVKGRGGLIGVASSPPELTVVPFGPADRLLMFTDGLVERRGEHIDVSLQRLVAASMHLRDVDDLNAVIDHLIQGVGPHTAPEDDLAIVAVQRKRVGRDRRAEAWLVTCGRVCDH